MAHIRWSPLSDLETLFEDARLLQAQLGRDIATDMYEENGNVVVEMHVAGIDPDKIDISVEGDEVRVSGSREEEKEEADRDYYAKEIKRGSFERVIELPAEVDGSKTRAEVRNGVLRIAPPILEEKTGHKIKVEKH